MADLALGFPAYQAKMRARFGAGDREIGHGFMRGLDIPRDVLPAFTRSPGHVAIVALIDGEFFALEVPAENLPALVDLWRPEVERWGEADARGFTECMAAYLVATGRHTGPQALQVAATIAWCAADEPAGLAPLLCGDRTLLCATTFDEAARLKHFRLSILD